jgi:NAD(P)-dependent dehydrogenase (short-subunit alcohol dehydrogenase family)
MTDKTAVVTGAASGIGRALAAVLGSRGYRLILADVDAGRLAETADELGGLAVPTDVSDPASMQGLADASGPCELLCLNAGIVSSSSGPPWESAAGEWQRVLAVNLGGVVNGLRSFVPLMMNRPGGSAILITASLAGVLTWPGGGPHAASKHAVLAVAEQAALDLMDKCITVTVQCPGLVRTAMSDQGEDPTVVAHRALDAVDHGRFAVVADGWTNAISDRSAMLMSGRQPIIPTPDQP